MGVPINGRPNQEPASSDSIFARSHSRAGPRPLVVQVQCSIVEQDESAVPGCLQIELNEIGTQPEGFFDRGHGVFRCISAGAAMASDLYRLCAEFF